MDNTLTFRIATGPQQWVGYWGYGDATQLEQTLKTILREKRPNQRWSISSQLAPRGLWVGLSASGLISDLQAADDLPDAWVRIENNRLSLGRQTFGRVTLYWMQQDQAIWFASQLQLLLPLTNPSQTNLAALYGYSCFSYVPTPLTPVIGISAIPAGVEVCWGRNDQGDLLPPKTANGWNWQQKSDPIRDESVAISQLETLLKGAVERQIADLSDEPVGVFLSGGLDSSIVAALLVQAGVKVRAYTLDLGEHSFPEYPYAEQVAHWLKIPLIKVDATPSKIRPEILPTLQALDMPFGDGVTVPLFLLNQVASQETQVIFNGEGGDQLFAGWTNKPLISALVYQTEHPDQGKLFEHHYLQTFHRLWGYETQVFQPTILNQIQQIQPQNWLYPALEKGTTQLLLHRLRRASLMLKGAQNIHPRATNLALSHGLYVRSPFCDLSLAEWTFQLSGELCLQGACEKYILKRVAQRWLPDEIVWREKRGMGVPLTAWCLQEWWPVLADWLNPSILEAEGRFQPNLAARIAFGKLGGGIQGRRIGEILWLLIIWELWRVHILGESMAQASWNHPFWLPYSVWRFKK